MEILARLAYILVAIPGLISLFMLEKHVLSWIIFFPLIGAAVILFLPKEQEELMKRVAALTTFFPLVMAFYIFLKFNRTSADFQFVEHAPWIPYFNIEYFLGIDGISVSMVLLTALLSFLCIFASWGIDKAVRGYLCLFLLLDTGMMGVFAALDFFLFFIFWEVMLLPMYFLIGIWGSPSRVDPDGMVRGGPYAAIKFFLYTLVGSALMLICILYFYFVHEPHTFNMTKLMASNTSYSPRAQWWLWVALYIGFAIKVPVFPFHTWLPDAHVEAPTAISVILAGILLKMGTYGLLRINYPMLPQATVQFSYFLAVMGMVNIIYGALCAMAQKDLKKLVAYSSISHMGYVLLGMSSFTPEGINGAVFQMFNHGTITAMLFLIVGVIYDRAHHRQIEEFGGLAQQMPIYSGITGLAFFAALGLPGLSAFISEALVFLGAFQRYTLITMLSVTGVILGAGYMLWTMQRVFLGPLNPKYATLPEINKRELFTLVPLGIIVIILGFYPMPVLNLLNTSLVQLNELVRSFL
jgi:NADH-quinone oxidoreductase subunit M